MTMNKGRTARSLAIALMTAGLVAVGTAEASAQPSQTPNAPVSVAPGGAPQTGLQTLGAHSLVAPANSGPVATTKSTGQIDEFQTVPGAIRHKSFNGGVWAAQPDLPLPPGGAHLRPGATWTPDGSRLDVFAADETAGHLYQNFWNGTVWSGWVDQGGVLLSAPSAQWTANGNRLDVFAIGLDGRLFQKAWNSASGWSDWTPFDVPEGALITAPSISWTAAGSRLDVVVVSLPSGHLFQKSYLGAPTNWTGWFDLGGVVASAPSAQWVGDGSRIDIFAIGTDGVIYQKTWKNTSGWTGFSGFNGPDAGLASAPGITWSTSGNRLDVFVGGADSGVHDKAWQAASGWGGWQAI
jgi:hypothetical protein